MKNLILTVIFSLSTLLSFSQYIEGKVLDVQTNKPIEGVHVFMKGINRGVLTNERGNFYLKFPFKIVRNDIIRFSHIGYEEIDVPYVQTKKNYKVYLKGDLKKLKEIRISEKRNLKQSISYKKLSSMKSGLHSFGSVLKDDKIYVIGGDNSIDENPHLKILVEYQSNAESESSNIFSELIKKGKFNFSKTRFKGDLSIYDIKSDTWSIQKKKFRKRAYHSVIQFEDEIIVLGGKRVSKSGRREYLEDKIEWFKLNNDSIEIDHTNPHKAASFSSFKYKNYILVMGGSLKKNSFGLKTYTDKVHAFNVKNGLWYELNPMNKAKEVNGILVSDKVYLLGGFNRKALTEIESLDLNTNQWKKEGDLFEGMESPAIANNKEVLYIFENGKMITFNTLTKELNKYLIGLDLIGSKMFFSKNQLYIVGGYRETGYSKTPSNKIYKINILEFENTKVQNSKTL